MSSSLVCLSRAAVLAGLLAGAAACGSSSATDSTPAIALRTPPGGAPAYIEVAGVSRPALRTADPSWTREQWAHVLRVAVEPEAPPVLGNYRVEDGAIRFVPLFPFDPGRPHPSGSTPRVLAKRRTALSRRSRAR